MAKKISWILTRRSFLNACNISMNIGFRWKYREIQVSFRCVFRRILLIFQNAWSTSGWSYWIRMAALYLISNLLKERKKMTVFSKVRRNGMIYPIPITQIIIICFHACKRIWVNYKDLLVRIHEIFLAMILV